MSLSGPDRPVKDQVLPVLDEGARGQVGPGERRRQPETLIFVEKMGEVLVLHSGLPPINRVFFI
jgi:hypothetical protein